MKVIMYIDKGWWRPTWSGIVGSNFGIDSVNEGKYVRFFSSRT